MIFASAGFNVKLFDIAESQVKAALEDIASQLKILEKDGLIRGNLSVGILRLLFFGNAYDIKYKNHMLWKTVIYSL